MEFDTGALSAFQGGLSQGSQIVQARQAHQLALQRMAMAQQAEQAQQQYQQQQLQQGQQRIDQQGQYNNARLGMTAQAAQQKQQGIQDTQQGNADIFTRGALAPAAGEQYMSGDHSPDSFFDTAQNLQQASQAFGQMSPQAQEPNIRAMYAQQSQQRAADIRMQIANHVRDGKIKTFETFVQNNPGYPPAMAERERAKILGGFDPGEIVTPQMYQQWPGFNSLPPEAQQPALDYVAQFGKAPTHEFFGPKQTADNSDIAAANAERRDYLDAHTEYTIARDNLREFDKHEDNKNYLKPPTRPKTQKVGGLLGMGGHDEQDPEWTRYEAVQAARAPLAKAVDDADKVRMEARKRGQEATAAMRTRGTRPAPAATFQPPQAPQPQDPNVWQEPPEHVVYAINLAWQRLGPNADPEEVKALTQKLMATGTDPQMVQ